MITYIYHGCFAWPLDKVLNTNSKASSGPSFYFMYAFFENMLRV